MWGQPPSAVRAGKVRHGLVADWTNDPWWWRKGFVNPFVLER
jgi:hypothetical protein